MAVLLQQHRLNDQRNLRCRTDDAVFSFYYFLTFVFLCFFMFSCRSDHGRIFWVDESRNVTLGMDKNKTDLTDYELNLVNAKGLRTLATHYQLGDSEISFLMDDESLLKETLYSLAETVPAMGRSLPAYPERSAAVARIEIRPKTLSGSSGKVSYVQFAIPLLESDLVAASQDIFLSRQVRMTEVSYKKIRIIDLDSAQRIPQASVIAVISGSYTDESSGENLAAWKNELYRPVIARSDENGEAFLLPLSHELGEISAYSVIAWAEGYCTYVSGELLLNNEEIPEISLRSCPDADQSTIGFKADFTNNYNVFEDIIPVDSVRRRVAYVSDRKSSVRVDSLSPVIRGIKLKVTEKHVPGGQENLSVPIVDYADPDQTAKFIFYSDLTFSVPFIFSYNNLENGDFLTHIFSSSAESETSVQDIRQLQTLYFKKNTTAPDLSFTDNLSIKGKIKEGIISGRSGSEFYLSSELCEDGMFLGVSEIAGDITFSSCDQHIATFSKDSVTFFEDSLSAGGKKTLNVWIKDRYNLVNEDDPYKHKNQIDVFVDYGLPDLASSPLSLGFDIGFAYAGSAQGTDSSRYFFPSGSLTDGVSDTVILDRSSGSSQIVFRSASPSGCKTNSDGDALTADGISSGDDGRMIEKWMLVKDSTQINNGTWASCASSSSLSSEDMTFTYDQISFPESDQENASFYLVVMDSAGNVSEPYQYLIPPCPASVTSVSGTAFCWKN